MVCRRLPSHRKCDGSPADRKKCRLQGHVVICFLMFKGHPWRSAKHDQNMIDIKKSPKMLAPMPSMHSIVYDWFCFQLHRSSPTADLCDQVNNSEMSEMLAVSKPVLVVPTDQVRETAQPHVQEERPMQKISVTKHSAHRLKRYSPGQAV